MYDTLHVPRINLGNFLGQIFDTVLSKWLFVLSPGKFWDKEGRKRSCLKFDLKSILSLSGVQIQ